MASDMKSVGATLKTLRDASGFSQSAIAAYLKVEPSFIAGYESGKSTLSSNMLDKLAALFGCTITSILNGTECYEPTEFLFPAGNLDGEELLGLAAINKIALNQVEMDEIN